MSAILNEETISYLAEYSIEVKPSNIDPRLLLFDIPGQGRKTKSGCGHVCYVKFCPDCNRAHPHDYHCKNYACPVCYSFAALQGAERAAKKLVGVYSELREIGINPGYMNHIVISLDKDRLDEFLFTRGKHKGEVNFEKLREHFYKQAKEIGITGGYLAIHVGRCKDELEFGVLEAQRLFGEEHARAWKGIQANVFDFGDWREYVEFGLHAHVVGYFKMKEISDKFFERTGCTYKNITVDSCKAQGVPVKPENYESLKAIIAYELGHHVYREGKHGITPFGIIKGCKKEKIGTNDVYEECKECGTDLVQISPLEYENFLVDAGSVNLENKKKVLRSKPIIRYLLRAKYKEQYMQMPQHTITEDAEKVKMYLENKRINIVSGDPPEKKPVRKFVPYRVKEDYVTQRVACAYMVNRKIV